MSPAIRMLNFLLMVIVAQSVVATGGSEVWAQAVAVPAKAPPPTADVDAIGQDLVELVDRLVRLKQEKKWREGLPIAIRIHELMAFAAKSKGADPSGLALAEVSEFVVQFAVEAGELEIATEYLEGMLAAYEKSYGIKSAQCADVATRLSQVRFRAGDQRGGEAAMIKALRAAIAVGGRLHDRVLGMIVGTLRYVEKPSPDFVDFIYNEWALRNPDSASFLVRVGLQRVDQWKEKERVVLLAQELQERHLQFSLQNLAEDDQLEYVSRLRSANALAVWVLFGFSKMSRDGANVVYSLILQTKGRVLEYLSRTAERVLKSADSKDRQLLEELRSLHTTLAGMGLNPPEKGGEVDFLAKARRLENRAHIIGRELAAVTPNLLSRSSFASVQEVQEALQDNAALVEFSVIGGVDEANLRHYGADAKSPLTKLQYGAVILKKTGPAEAIMLGEAAELDRLVIEFRRELSTPDSKNITILARRLEQRLFENVRSHMGGVRRLVIAPDGILNLLPFEALVDQSGSLLIERYAINYVGSGRDLVRRVPAGSTGQGAVIVGNPDYNANIAVDPQGSLSTQRALRSRDYGSRKFEPLPGTADEAETVRNLIGGRTLLGPAATEADLKRVRSPLVLHVATHGFFLADLPAESNTATSRQSLSTEVRATFERIRENPMIRSGLALAGANNPGPSENDGILTALEVSGMNLIGTRLVVLSACETGLGDLKVGEGVFGLRRALLLAGAETQVLSLWQVDDLATRDLMAEFYKGLTKGIRAGDALRNAKLNIIRSPERKHPFYWASFVLSGNENLLLR